MRSGIVICVLCLILLAGALFFVRNRSEQTSPPSPQLVPSPTMTSQKETVDIAATFTIKTDSITRSFLAAKYHNQSPDVFITAADPSRVRVKKKGVTWSDFFATLPMKLTKECLITGDGETLCDGKQGTLRFYLNDVEDKNLLDKEIKNGDSALIIFTSN